MTMQTLTRAAAALAALQAIFTVAAVRHGSLWGLPPSIYLLGSVIWLALALGIISHP